jgi:hypothetical protein
MTETTETKTVKVGTVFYSSWGYDQTNVDFAVVTAVSRSGKTATFVELTKGYVGSTERVAGGAAQCRHCYQGVRKLVKVDGSTVWRHVGTGETECKFYGYRAERLAEEGRVLHADVEEFTHRVKVSGYDGRFVAYRNTYSSWFENDRESHYETAVGMGH